MNTKNTGKELDLFTNQLIDGKRIANTSIIGFHSEPVQQAMKTAGERILIFLKNNPPATTRQISEALGIEIGTIAGRITPLRYNLIIYIADVQPCPTTGTKARFYSMVTPETIQAAKDQVKEEKTEKLDKLVLRVLALLDDLDRYQDQHQDDDSQQAA